ncbi:unnamed protein product [Amoebophrya sp. A120]|nr:unnamed protein product [Amoebophrya sp. A120]|eukprot:GSA120T00016471001.1
MLFFAIARYFWLNNSSFTTGLSALSSSPEVEEPCKKNSIDRDLVWKVTGTKTFLEIVERFPGLFQEQERTQELHAARFSAARRSSASCIKTETVDAILYQLLYEKPTNLAQAMQFAFKVSSLSWHCTTTIPAPRPSNNVAHDESSLSPSSQNLHLSSPLLPRSRFALRTFLERILELKSEFLLKDFLLQVTRLDVAFHDITAVSFDGKASTEDFLHEHDHSAKMAALADAQRTSIPSLYSTSPLLAEALQMCGCADTEASEPSPLVTRRCPVTGYPTAGGVAGSVVHVAWAKATIGKIIGAGEQGAHKPWGHDHFDAPGTRGLNPVEYHGTKSRLADDEPLQEQATFGSLFENQTIHGVDRTTSTTATKTTTGGTNEDTVRARAVRHEMTSGVGLSPPARGPEQSLFQLPSWPSTHVREDSSAGDMRQMEPTRSSCTSGGRRTAPASSHSEDYIQPSSSWSCPPASAPQHADEDVIDTSGFGLSASSSNDCGRKGRWTTPGRSSGGAAPTFISHECERERRQLEAYDRKRQVSLRLLDGADGEIKIPYGFSTAVDVGVTTGQQLHDQPGTTEAGFLDSPDGKRSNTPPALLWGLRPWENAAPFLCSQSRSKPAPAQTTYATSTSTLCSSETAEKTRPGEAAEKTASSSTSTSFLSDDRIYWIDSARQLAEVRRILQTDIEEELRERDRLKHAQVLADRRRTVERHDGEDRELQGAASSEHLPIVAFGYQASFDSPMSVLTVATPRHCFLFDMLNHQESQLYADLVVHVFEKDVMQGAILSKTGAAATAVATRTTGATDNIRKLPKVCFGFGNFLLRWNFFRHSSRGNSYTSSFPDLHQDGGGESSTASRFATARNKFSSVIDLQGQRIQRIFVPEGDLRTSSEEADLVAAKALQATQEGLLSVKGEASRGPRTSAQRPATAVVADHQTNIASTGPCTTQSLLINAAPSVKMLQKRFGLDGISDTYAGRTGGYSAPDEQDFSNSNWNYRPLHQEQVRFAAKQTHQLLRLEKKLRQKNCFPCKQFSLER